LEALQRVGHCRTRGDCDTARASIARSDGCSCCRLLAVPGDLMPDLACGRMKPISGNRSTQADLKKNRAHPGVQSTDRLSGETGGISLFRWKKGQAHPVPLSSGMSLTLSSGCLRSSMYDDSVRPGSVRPGCPHWMWGCSKSAGRSKSALPPWARILSTRRSAKRAQSGPLSLDQPNPYVEKTSGLLGTR
jgi:hypothetical protein